MTDEPNKKLHDPNKIEFIWLFFFCFFFWQDEPCLFYYTFHFIDLCGPGLGEGPPLSRRA